VNIPRKIQCTVNSICNAYRLKGEAVATKRLNYIANRDNLKNYEMVMLAGYVRYQLGFRYQH
jgi:hypothetical protein